MRRPTEPVEVAGDGGRPRTAHAAAREVLPQPCSRRESRAIPRTLILMSKVFGLIPRRGGAARARLLPSSPTAVACHAHVEQILA